MSTQSSGARELETSGCRSGDPATPIEVAMAVRYPGEPGPSLATGIRPNPAVAVFQRDRDLEDRLKNAALRT